MKRTNSRYLPVLIIGAIIGMVIIFPVASLVSAGSEGIYSEIELFTDSMALIRDNYVDEVDMKELIHGAIKGMTATLDPHSQFMEPDNYEEMKVETEGEFGGIGIEITIKDNLLTIVSPIHDTPGSRAGLMADDKITRIDEQTTKDITIHEAVKLMRGKPGDQVTLTIYRESENKILYFDIVRDIIKVKSINTAVMLTKDIGYIHISQFQEKTSRELREALDELQERGLQGLILDLRYNPGGLLDMAVSVAGEFLDNATLVVYTKGRLPGQNVKYFSQHAKSRPEFPMVVLINRGSASASEIVAGAIQDHKRGVILGSKSFGKASVQTVIPLRDKSAMKLTTAKYFTPNGRMIHETGIIPDIEVSLTGEEEIEFVKNRREILNEMVEKYKAEFDVASEEENGKAEAPEAANIEDVIDDIEEIKQVISGGKEGDKNEENILEDKVLERAMDLLKGIIFYSSADQVSVQDGGGS